MLQSHCLIYAHPTPTFSPHPWKTTPPHEAPSARLSPHHHHSPEAPCLLRGWRPQSALDSAPFFASPGWSEDRTSTSMVLTLLDSAPQVLWWPLIPLFNDTHRHALTLGLSQNHSSFKAKPSDVAHNLPAHQPPPLLVHLLFIPRNVTHFFLSCRSLLKSFWALSSPAAPDTWPCWHCFPFLPCQAPALGEPPPALPSPDPAHAARREAV